MERSKHTTPTTIKKILYPIWALLLRLVAVEKPFTGRLAGVVIDAPRGVFNPRGTVTTLLTAYSAAKCLECPRRMAEPGAGSGAASILYAKTCDPEMVVMTDIDPGAVEAAKRNAEANGEAHRVTIVQCNWLDCIRSGAVEAAMLNPPYLPCPPSLAPQLCCGYTCIELLEAIKSCLEKTGRLVYTVSSLTPINPIGRQCSTVKIWLEKITTYTLEPHNH